MTYVTEKRGRGRPPKDPAGRRVAKISTYVSDEVAEALRAESDVRGMTISELVATVLEGHVYGAKKDVQLPPVPKDAVYAVMRMLAEEGLLKDSILGANLTSEMNSSYKFAPQTPDPAPLASKAKEQCGDDSNVNVAPRTRRRRKGGEGNDS